MSLTVVKYRKTPTGNLAISPTVIYRPRLQTQAQFIKKPFVKLAVCNANETTTSTTTGIVLNQIPAIIKSSMKRAATTTTTVAAPLLKTPKYLLQSSSAAGSSTSTSLQWQTTLGEIKKEQLGAAISALPPNTIIKATTRPATTISNNSNVLLNNVTAITSTMPTGSAASVPSIGSVTSPVRQAVFIKRDMPQRTMRSMTLGLIDQNPLLHLGILPERLPLLKRTICRTANVTHLDCCITLKKLRQNESFALLAEYFELSESDVEETFTRTLVKLARYLRHLIRWSDSKRFYERLKYVPVAYRRNLLHVQSLIECVETDVDETLNLGCASYKFILCINTNGIVSYISDAYRGDCDDLQLFEATDFKARVPTYLTLCSEPGKAVPRRRSSKSRRDRAALLAGSLVADTDSLTDSADEDDAVLLDEDTQPLSKYDAQRVGGQLAAMQSLEVVDGALTSTRAQNIRVPTLRVREPACRSQMRDMVDALRQFKLLGHCAVRQAPLFSYLNEMLIVAAALSNLQR